MPINMATNGLKLNPLALARLGVISAVSPVVIVQWTATGLTLICDAVFPGEQRRPIGTAIVILCDKSGCQPLEQKRSSVHLALT